MPRRTFTLGAAVEVRIAWFEKRGRWLPSDDCEWVSGVVDSLDNDSVIVIASAGHMHILDQDSPHLRFVG
jgi:hypothetical protein